MIKKVKDGYILETGIKVMFLTKQQMQQFNDEQELLRIKKEYKRYIKAKKEGTLFGIEAVYSIDPFGKEISYLLDKRFDTYNSALIFLKKTGRLYFDYYKIISLN